MKISFSFHCPMKWDEMEGTETTRHCSACDKSVHALSNMTPAAARAFASRVAGKEICIQAVFDRNGDVVFDKRIFAAVTAAGLATASPALADGQIPTLSNADDGGDIGIEADAALEDVSDVDCNGGKAPGDAPNLDLGVAVPGVEAELEEIDLSGHTFYGGAMISIQAAPPVLNVVPVAEDAPEEGDVPGDDPNAAPLSD